MDKIKNKWRKFKCFLGIHKLERVAKFTYFCEHCKQTKTGEVDKQPLRGR